LGSPYAERSKNKNGNTLSKTSSWTNLWKMYSQPPVPPPSIAYQFPENVPEEPVSPYTFKQQVISTPFSVDHVQTSFHSKLSTSQHKPSYQRRKKFDEAVLDEIQKTENNDATKPDSHSGLLKKKSKQDLQEKIKNTSEESETITKIEENLMLKDKIGDVRNYSKSLFHSLQN